MVRARKREGAAVAGDWDLDPAFWGGAAGALSSAAKGMVELQRAARQAASAQDAYSAAVRRCAEWQRAIVRIQAHTGLSHVQVEELRDKALAAAAATGQEPLVALDEIVRVTDRQSRQARALARAQHWKAPRGLLLGAKVDRKVYQRGRQQS